MRISHCFFVQENLAGKKTKMIKGKKRGSCSKRTTAILLTLVGCGSGCATIEVDSKA